MNNLLSYFLFLCQAAVFSFSLSLGILAIWCLVSAESRYIV